MTLIQIANMNERIKALLLNARNMFDNGVTDSNNKIYIHGSEENLAKFAELIVAECISINRQRMFSEWESDSHRVAHNNALLCANSDMFEHFGVEEPVQVSNLHYCPYAAEINGDYETLCDCDEERTYQCAMDT